jgi:adenine specific DNA methylase Mod
MMINLEKYKRKLFFSSLSEGTDVEKSKHFKKLEKIHGCMFWSEDIEPPSPKKTKKDILFSPRDNLLTI